VQKPLSTPVITPDKRPTVYGEGKLQDFVYPYPSGEVPTLKTRVGQSR